MRILRFLFRISCIFLILVIFGACDRLQSNLSSLNLRRSNIALLWTDHPEFAIYAGYFNASQDKYKVEVRYFESPAQEIIESGEHPDIVAASWLLGASLRTYFMRLDSLFKRGGLSHSSFYPRLLALGNVDGNQYLLPVSYNIPAMVFARDYSQQQADPFIIGMNEIKERSQAFNIVNRGVYTRMGFSLTSNDDFLFIAAVLSGAAFREANPIVWDNQALEQSIRFIQNWINEANTSFQVEDDFVFKYFYEPPDKLINSGRILFAYMDSSSFFTLPEDRRTNLDFRWIAADERIPLKEWTVYYGIHRRTKASNAAKAFTRWFFDAETQRQLLEAGQNKQLGDSFGISGGFSSMKTVTEQVFPLFYPDLLGRMPPETYLSPGNILPRNWMDIKRRVILPYLRERIRHENREDVRSMERRLNDWYRINRY